jgi:hypothetical protein
VRISPLESKWWHAFLKIYRTLHILHMTTYFYKLPVIINNPEAGLINVRMTKEGKSVTKGEQACHH